MSCLLGILRHFFGWEEDDNIAYRRSYGEYSENSTRILSSFKVPAQDEFPLSGNTSTACLNNQTPKDASIESKTNKRNLEKLIVASGKPNVLTLSSTLMCVSGKLAIDGDANKPHDHKLSSNSSFFYSQPFPSSSKPPAFSSKAPLSSYESSPHLFPSSLSALKPPPSSPAPETPLLSSKPTLSQSIHQKKSNDILDKSASPTYRIVGNLEDWIKKDISSSPPQSSLKADSSFSSSQTLFSSPKLPQSYLDSFETRKITTCEVKTVAKDATISSETIKRKLEKLNEAFGKPKEFDTSSTLTCACGKVTINLDVNKSNDHKLSCNSSSFPSQPSPSSSKPPAVVSKAPSSYYRSSPYLSSPPPSFLMPSSSSTKPTLSQAMLQKKANHNVDKSASPTCIVDNFENWIKKDFPSAPPGSPLKPDSSSSSSQTSVSSPKPRRCSSKPTVSEDLHTPTMNQRKTNYIWVQKDTSSIYKVPENVEDLIKQDILPQVLKKPLSPLTYKDFFHTLLYAEDYYIEKWDEFIMENVTLEVEEAVVYSKKGKRGNLNQGDLKEEDDRVFVAFEMDSVPEKRPFLLSRDFASVRPSCSKIEPFQGIIYRVVKSNRVLVEFGKDFHSRHHPDCKYDVKFSFNRICLKRAHQAIGTASDCLLKTFLFPNSDCSSAIYPLPSLYHCTGQKLDRKGITAVRRICNHNGPPPYLLEGPPCITENQCSRIGVLETRQLSSTGVVIREAVLHTYRTNPGARILICAPTNVTCDMLVKSLQEEIPESAIFRANAAFREIDEGLLDILPSCRLRGECFSCPSLKELRNFKVISSTYMSCFRLHNEGLVAGEFSQMFMLDASSTTEPETLVALANFADESTNVIITGTPGNRSRWVRSPMARRKGLMRSYFERLRESKLYESLDPNLISQL